MKDLYFEPTQDGKEETLSLLAKLENEIGELWKYLTKNKQDKKIYELYSFLKFCMPSNNLDFKGELDLEQIKAMCLC